MTSAEAERFADEVCWAAFALTLADPEDLVPTELITAVAGVLQSTKPESTGTGLRSALRRLAEIATFLGSCHQDMEAAMEVRATLDTIVAQARTRLPNDCPARSDAGWRQQRRWHRPNGDRQG